MQALEGNPVLIAQVIALAKSAGERIMGVYADMLAASPESTAALVSHKDDGSPLTRADLLAHQVIAQGLAALTPQIAVVSEEDAQSLVHRLPTGTFWLIDPLDGTKEFLARNGEFTVNIALIQNGAAIFGVVLAPALGQYYWGGVELGAFRSVGQRVEPIKVSQAGERKSHPLRVVASKSHMNAQTVEFINRLGPHQLIQAGSSLKFCRVAEGAADVYPRLGPTCEWDTAAAQAIVEAAGGSVCALDGSTLHYGKADLLNPHFVAASATVANWLPAA